MWLVKSNYGEPFGCRKIDVLLEENSRNFQQISSLNQAKTPRSFLMRQNWLGSSPSQGSLQFWMLQKVLTPLCPYDPGCFVVGCLVVAPPKGAYPVTPSERKEREERPTAWFSQLGLECSRRCFSMGKKKHMDKPFDTNSFQEISNRTHWTDP